MAEAPLADEPGGIAGLIHEVGDGEGVGGHGRLAFGLDFLVAADRGVAVVLARHERASRRRADRRAGVGLGEPHALGREPVDVRRLDELLPETAEVAVAEVIREDEDDVGPVRCNHRAGAHGRHEDQRRRQD